MLIRFVHLVFQAPGQQLEAPERTGFTVVEWGGAKASGKQVRPQDDSLEVFFCLFLDKYLKDKRVVN